MGAIKKAARGADLSDAYRIPSGKPENVRSVGDVELRRCLFAMS